MTTGEAAIRRWRDGEPSFKGALGRLVAATAYNTRFQVEKSTKTDVEKCLPVHPVLHEILTTWNRAGWERFTGRAPGPDDLIVPAVKGGIRENSATGKDWTDDLVRMGRPHQRHHESRATFRSLALAGGADEKDLDRLTHPSPKTASEVYTRTGIIWPRLCRPSLAIQIPHRESVYTPRMHPAGLRVVAKEGNRPDGQGEEEVLYGRRDRGIERAPGGPSRRGDRRRDPWRRSMAPRLERHSSVWKGTGKWAATAPRRGFPGESKL
jgi:hypothetical protein